MGISVDETVVIKSVRVRVSKKRAFSVFVEQMETWWPATHHIAREPFELIVVEPRVGGRWYERSASGVEGEWGTVLGWDPPNSVRLSWHLGPGHDSPDWVADMDMAKASEVEVRFLDLDAETTIVELIHSKLERHGEGWQQLRGILDGPGAWVTILESFAGAMDEKEAR
ncbi:MAG TPA: SRPBCC family protein [Terracidiphilus sp.]|jgi:hypothetical protein|nr:SRPBCC family protein [Terracidiphilus sp.]